MATSQAPTRQAITLKGSTNLVTEFFKYAANTYALLAHGTPHILTIRQDLVPAGRIPLGRLSHGQKVRSDRPRHTGPRTRKLPRSVGPMGPPRERHRALTHPKES